MSFLTFTISPFLRSSVVRSSSRTCLGKNFLIIFLKKCLALYSVGKKLVAEKEDESYVEANVEKLCKYVCINYQTNGKILKF